MQIFTSIRPFRNSAGDDGKRGEIRDQIDMLKEERARMMLMGDDVITECRFSLQPAA